MNHFDIDIQIESSYTDIPLPEKLISFATHAIEKASAADITIRVVDEEESQVFNSAYRHKEKPTNVLSFPYSSLMEETLEGDLLLCAPLIHQEALSQEKPLEAHWAHLIIHGILHLQGYDHTEEKDAAVMEQREINLLSQLGFPNPYE